MRHWRRSSLCPLPSLSSDTRSSTMISHAPKPYADSSLWRTRKRRFCLCPAHALLHTAAPLVCSRTLDPANRPKSSAAQGHQRESCRALVITAFQLAPSQAPSCDGATVLNRQSVDHRTQTHIFLPLAFAAVTRRVVAASTGGRSAPLSSPQVGRVLLPVLGTELVNQLRATQAPVS